MAKTKCSLLQALEFLKPTQSKRGEPMQNHVRLANHFAVGFDRVLAIGHPIVEDITVCANSFALMELLKQADGPGAFTVEDASTLRYQCGEVKASIPCVNPASIPHVVPDAPQQPANDALKAGFKTWGALVGNGETILESSLLLTENSMVVTDRAVLVEFWHGFGLPKPVAVPKVFVKAVAAVKHKVVAVGYGASTVTVHFGNGAWIQTQVYKEGWPAYAQYFDDGVGAEDIDPAFFANIEKVMPFSRGKKVLITPGTVCSHDPLVETVTMSMPCPANFNFWFRESALLFSEHMTKMKFTGNGDPKLARLHFFSRKVRAVVMNDV